jgi:hypothetical protein
MSKFQINSKKSFSESADPIAATIGDFAMNISSHGSMDSTIYSILLDLIIRESF